MIRVSRLNGSKLVLNALLIERIEATPDTVIRLTTGRQYVVRETPDEICELAVAYLRTIRGADPTAAPLAQISRAIK